MLDTELEARFRLLGIPAKKAAALTADIRDRLHPVAAVAATALRNKREPGLSGNTRSSFSMASTGASVGKFVGPVGAAVGAVIGAIAGLAIHTGQKPQRRAASIQVLQQLRALPIDGVGRLLEYGSLGNPTGFLALGQALYLGAGWVNEEGSKLIDHPTSMDNLTLSYIDNAKRAVQAALASSAPVMAQISKAPTTLAEKFAMARDRAGMRGYGNANLDTNRMFTRSPDMYQSGNGLGDYPGATVTMTLKGVGGTTIGPFSFVNPGLQASALDWATRVFMPMIREIRLHTAFSANADRAANDPDAIHVFALLADKLLSEFAPDSLSTTAATSPVASMPSNIVNAGYKIAGDVIKSGITTPTLVTPVNQYDPNVPYTLPGVAPPGVTYGTATRGPNQADYNIVGPTPTWIKAGNTMPYVSVPYAAAPGSNYVVTPTSLNPQQDSTAGIMQTTISKDYGINLTSPDAQDTLAQVSREGVQKTQSGPVAGLPAWAIPAGIGAAFLALMLRK